MRNILKQFGIEVQNDKTLQQAFTHSSYVNENRYKNLDDNERLELLGDAVLQLWSADFLFHQEPQISEGNMTLLRAQLVNEESLATYSRQLGLNRFLKLGVGEMKNGGLERDSILADSFEAFIGAIYLDQGFKAIDKICQKVIGDKFYSLDKDDLMDYKTRLQEFVQSDSRKSVVYQIVASWGPANRPSFEAIVKLDDIILGTGVGTSKKRAQQEAAKDALNKLAK